MLEGPKSDRDWIPALLLRLRDPDQVIFEKIGLATCDSHDGLAMLTAPPSFFVI